MAKKVVKTRGKFADEKYLGPEPDLSNGIKTEIELLKAYNWYNYFFNHDDAKEFVISYLRSEKASKTIIKNISRVDPFRLVNIGWNCRILSNGGKLPDYILTPLFEKIKTLSDSVNSEDGDEDVSPKNVVSIQERIASKVSDILGDIEGEIDEFIINGKSSFDPDKFMRTKDIKPQIAQKISDFYKPLYSELFDAHLGKDVLLKEAYSHLKKARLKAYLEFIKNIITAADSRIVIAKTIRKPRKKKEKLPSAIVSKMKYQIEDTSLNIKSVKPTDIIGSNQLWVFNTKTRMLSVYNAMGPAGLNVKGSTLTGFDEKTSIIKKLRKPQEQIKSLLEAGKVNLRKYMESVKSVAKTVNGRINNNTVLVRIIK